MKKKVLIAAAAVVVLLVIVIIALPLFIDGNKYKPTLETDLSTALGRKVSIGNIKLSILSGGVTVDDVAILDDPSFSQSPFLTAKQLDVGVALLPLIFSKEIDVESFTITDPQVSLVRSASGKWNFASLGGSQPKSSPSNTSAENVSVGKVKISNGSIVVRTTAPGGKQRTYQNVNLSASNLSYTSDFPFTLSASTPGGGTIKLDGKAGPLDPSDGSLTPVHATINVAHLDLASTGFVDPASGVAGLVDFQGTITSDGHSMNSKGTLKAAKFKVVPNGAPSNVPVNVDYDTDYDLKAQTGVLKDGDLHIGRALARLAGTYNAAGEVTKVELKLTGQAMPVPDLEGTLPAFGVTLPSGASLKTGTLELSLSVTGPLDKLTITGPINLANGDLAGFNLKSKLGALGSFAGLGGSKGSDTEIQKLTANLRVDPSGTNADNLDLVVAEVGTITGTGNVSSSGQLNCKMVANLSGAGGAIGTVDSALTSLTGGKNSKGGGGIPFRITGTTANPIFLPDLSGMAGNALKGAANPGGAAAAASGVLGGFLKK